MPRTFPKVAAMTAGFAVIVATLGGGVMLARADGTPTPTPGATSSATPPKNGKDPKAFTDDFIQKLADNLGIPVQTLKDALKKTSLDELDKAVADGKLTQDQANKIRDAINNGAPGGFGFNIPFFGGRGPGGGKPNGAAPNGATPNGAPNIPGSRGGFGLGPANDDAIATFLGIDADTLHGELKNGKTLVQVAEAHGKTRDELKTFITSQEDAQIAAAVTAGKLTQAQADAIKANQSGQVDKFIDAQQPGHGPKPPSAKPRTAPSNPSSGGA